MVLYFVYHCIKLGTKIWFKQHKIACAIQILVTLQHHCIVQAIYDVFCWNYRYDIMHNMIFNTHMLYSIYFFVVWYCSIKYNGWSGQKSTCTIQMFVNLQHHSILQAIHAVFMTLKNNTHAIFRQYIFFCGSTKY